MLELNSKMPRDGFLLLLGILDGPVVISKNVVLAVCSDGTITFTCNTYWQCFFRIAFIEFLKQHHQMPKFVPIFKHHIETRNTNSFLKNIVCVFSEELSQIVFCHLRQASASFVFPAKLITRKEARFCVVLELAKFPDSHGAIHNHPLGITHGWGRERERGRSIQNRVNNSHSKAGT